MKWIGILVVCFAVTAHAQTYDTNGVYVQTFVGSGFSGWVDGVGQQTMFNRPSQIVCDTTGNLFVMDVGNNVFRKVQQDGTVSSYVTNYTFGAGGNATIDRSNNIWAFSPYGTTLTKISSNQTVSSRVAPFVFSVSDGICSDSVGNVYLASGANNKIYRYTTNGAFEVFVGSGNQGSQDGNGIFCSFNTPRAMCSDSADNIYVWDSGNYLIRKVSQNRDVITIAGHYAANNNVDGIGTNAAFGMYGISSMFCDTNGRVLIAMGTCIRAMAPDTTVTTLAGTFTGSDYVNGAGASARFSGATGVCVYNGTIYVADSANQRIRSITNNPIAQQVSAANLQLSTFAGIRIIGTVGRTYRIDSSSDNQTWTQETTILLNQSPYLWIDENAVSQNKFYRAFLLP